MSQDDGSRRTLLEPVVLGVELCIVLRLLLALVEPAYDVLVVSSRLLLVVYFRPKMGTDTRGTMNSSEEL